MSAKLKVKVFYQNAPDLKSIDFFSTCDHPTCEKATVRIGACLICGLSFCGAHSFEPFHDCLSLFTVSLQGEVRRLVNEVNIILGNINVKSLLRHASTLRDGVVGRFIPRQDWYGLRILGSKNFNAVIRFEDKVSWVLRTPRTTLGLPHDLIEYLLDSENATLEWLERVNIPTPVVHDSGLISDLSNPVGVDYLLMDAMEGTPFAIDAATNARKRHVLSQYADMLIEISKHPHHLACSLSSSGVDKIASNRFLTVGEHGPYVTALEYFTSIANLHLGVIAEGQVHPDHVMEAVALYTLFRDEVAPVLAHSCETDELARNFYLKHGEDKGDHILVNKEFEITGIIDWQFSRFVPAYEAFGPPMFTTDYDRMLNGPHGLSADDWLLAILLRSKGRDDLANLVQKGDLVRRFHYGFGPGIGVTRVQALRMIGAVLQLLGLVTHITLDQTAEWVQNQWNRECNAEIRKKVADWQQHIMF